MRTLIATTALALILGGPTLAQEQGQTAQQPAAETQGEMAAGLYQAQPGDLLVANVLGAQVFAPQAEGAQQAGAQTEQTQSAEPMAADDQATAGTEPATVEQTAQTGQTEQEPGQTQTPTTQADLAGQQQPDAAQAGQTSGTAQQVAGMENIGTVEDMVISGSGEPRAILVDVGGFLGIGSRTIALDLQQAELRPDESDPSRVYVISQIALDQLEGAPEFDREQLEQGDQMASESTAAEQGVLAQTGAEQPVAQNDTTVFTTEPADGAAATDQAATADPAAAEQEQAAATGEAWRGGRQPMVAPMMEREGYQAMEAGQFTADNLMGANVYDANDENIGNVSDVVLNPEGQLEAVVLDVGGFLGFGSHTVAIGLDEMTILTNEGGDDLRAYVDVTQEQLEQMPQYEGGDAG